jgi:hypothetical protein
VGAWRFGIEDLLFAFAFSGTSAGLFMWLVEGRSKRPSILPTGRISPARMAMQNNCLKNLHRSPSGFQGTRLGVTCPPETGPV